MGEADDAPGVDAGVRIWRAWVAAAMQRDRSRLAKGEGVEVCGETFVVVGGPEQVG